MQAEILRASREESERGDRGGSDRGQDREERSQQVTNGGPSSDQDQQHDQQGARRWFRRHKLYCIRSRHASDHALEGAEDLDHRGHQEGELYFSDLEGMNWTISEVTNSQIRLVMEESRGSNRFGEEEM